MLSRSEVRRVLELCTLVRTLLVPIIMTSLVLMVCERQCVRTAGPGDPAKRKEARLLGGSRASILWLYVGAL